MIFSNLLHCATLAPRQWATVPCLVAYYTPRRSSGFHVCHPANIFTLTHTNAHEYMCVCVRVFFGVGVGFASHNVIYFWRNCGAGNDKGGEEGIEGGGRQSGTDRRSQSQPRRSRVEPIRTSGHCQPSPPKERALYLTLSLSLTVSRSLFPLYGSMCGH